MAKKNVTAKVDPKNPKNIQFINQDVTSKGSVDIRIRGDQMFIESEAGAIRIGIGKITNKETGEIRNRLYAHVIEKREQNSQTSAVAL